ncbi:ferritin-1, chloroplastic [Nicotiana attenuata]|uniref:Ferritin n=1 Tax=Nicotiana attenuata TaxID=49451 RepID=A0A314LC25_NICAT|nr:ferritin-1, chloroplastic [Nicotiana attenuata]
MELVLCLEESMNQRLLNMHVVASRSNDVYLADFLEREFLFEHVDAIKKTSAYVAQLRRVGQGHGIWQFHQMLLNEEAKKEARSARFTSTMKADPIEEDEES